MSVLAFLISVLRSQDREVEEFILMGFVEVAFWIVMPLGVGVLIELIVSL